VVEAGMVVVEVQIFSHIQANTHPVFRNHVIYAARFFNPVTYFRIETTSKRNP